MPRPTKVPALTASQARYILEKLIDEKTVTAADIRRHVSGMWEEMNALEKRIAELRGIASNVHPIRAAKRTASRVASSVTRTGRKARRVSAEVMASRKLQGQYIAAIRRVPKSQRAKYAKIAKEEGREKAIAAIRKNSA